MSTLYELKGRAQEVAEELEHTDDLELRAALIDELDALHEALDDKIEAYCVVIKNLAAEEHILEEEAKRLRGRAERISATRESILERLQSLVPANLKWKRGAHTLKWRKSKAVKVVCESDIPTLYMREILKYEPDKKQIATDLKAGATIPGVVLEERNNLSIE